MGAIPAPLLPRLQSSRGSSRSAGGNAGALSNWSWGGKKQQSARGCFLQLWARFAARHDESIGAGLQGQGANSTRGHGRPEGGEQDQGCCRAPVLPVLPAAALVLSPKGDACVLQAGVCKSTGMCVQGQCRRWAAHPPAWVLAHTHTRVQLAHMCTHTGVASSGASL